MMLKGRISRIAVIEIAIKSHGIVLVVSFLLGRSLKSLIHSSK